MTVISHYLAPGVAALAADGRQWDEFGDPHDPPGIRKLAAVDGLLIANQGAAELLAGESIDLSEFLSGTGDTPLVDVLAADAAAMPGVDPRWRAQMVFEQVLERCWRDVEADGHLGRALARLAPGGALPARDEYAVVTTCAWVDAGRIAHARRVVLLIYDDRVEEHSDERWECPPGAPAVRGVSGPHPEATERLEAWLSDNPPSLAASGAAAELAALEVIEAGRQVLADDPYAPGGRLHAVSATTPAVRLSAG